MLLYGKLPSVAELEAYKRRLISYRELPDSLKAALRLVRKKLTRWTLCEQVAPCSGT